MKAFLINSLSTGGAEKVVWVLAREFAVQKKKISIICMEKNDFFVPPENVQVYYLSKMVGKEHGVFKLFWLLLFALRLKQIIKKEKITLVQSHLYRANYVNVLAKKIGSKHVTQIVNHGIVSRYLHEGILGKINIALIKFLYPYADLIITVSQWMRKDLLSYIDVKNIKVINNPYDVHAIEQMQNEKIHLDDIKKYIISVGRLVPLKQHSDLIKAFNLIKDQYPNLEILICGDGEMRSQLENEIKVLNINDRVTFTGNINNPFKYIKRSSIFVLTSSTEGFPNSLVEALLCGVPVVSTDCISGPREILAPKSDQNMQLHNTIEKAEYGILVPVSNHKLLARAISELLNDTSLYCKYKGLCKKRGNHFSVENIIGQYDEVLFND